MNAKFTINLKTAKAMGIELSTSALLRADEVIELRAAQCPLLAAQSGHSEMSAIRPLLGAKRTSASDGGQSSIL